MLARESAPDLLLTAVSYRLVILFWALSSRFLKLAVLLDEEAGFEEVLEATDLFEFVYCLRGLWDESGFAKVSWLLIVGLRFLVGCLRGAAPNDGFDETID